MIPPLAGLGTTGIEPLLKRRTEPIEQQIGSDDDLASPWSDISRATGSSGRSNTFGSSVSASPTNAYSKNKYEETVVSMDSSQSSFTQRDGYDSMSEADSIQTAQHFTSQQSRPNASSSSIGPSGTPGTGSANLSGLVCNVHHTTGKEPHALVGATTTILGDKLYVFGGRRVSRTNPWLTSDLYELDLICRHWTKLETKGDVPPPRYFHTVCALGDSKLVCYGGMSPESPGVQNDQQESQVSVMSDVHIYDVPTHTWLKVATAEAPQGRYAHCAAILPSSAVFASTNAPMSAIQHNPASTMPNQGSIGVSLDGQGGAEMVVVGGQDSTNQYIEQISVFNLRSLKWTSTRPMSGRSCGAYRSVVTPLTSMSVAQIGAGCGRLDEDENDGDDEADASLSGAAMLVYTNYNFLDVKLELQARLPDGSLTEKPMQGAVSPPGLRFPSGGVIDNNFVVAGTFLTSSKQEYALWALDLRTLTWARIDTGSSVFSQGSWNRGVLWNRRNTFVVLGNRKRSLMEDYNSRRLNFSNICLVQLEAFGLYENPRIQAPMSGYISKSASSSPAGNRAIGGRQLSHAAEGLGERCLGLHELADMEFLAIDDTRLHVNSRLIAHRWGPSFDALLREGLSSPGGIGTATLRGSTAADMTSRNSSNTITPSDGTTYSTATTLVTNPWSATSAQAASAEGPCDVRILPPASRSRRLYLPHTAPTLQALIYYLYTSSLPASPSVLATPQIFCSLLQLARPYKIDGLLEAVVKRLHESLDGRNAAAIFNAAAMGAGGGEGVVFASENTAVHPPRNASLAGMSLDGLTITNGSLSARSNLRIDTDVASTKPNGRPARNTILASTGSAADSSADSEDDVPGSASTDASMHSETSLTALTLSKRSDRDIWDGEWSAVIGLQKRGLRGLMEGRRIRERGRSDGAGEGKVGLGII